MLLIPIDRCAPGMVAAAALPHPQRCHTPLLRAGVKLTDGLIGRMKDLKVARVWIKHPLLRDLAPLSQSRLAHRRREVYHAIENGLDELQYRAITTADYDRYSLVIRQLTRELTDGGGPAGGFSEPLFADDNELAAHCCRVACLSVAIGLRLSDYIAAERRVAGVFGDSRDLTDLGVGAMLHDVGKIDGCESIRRQHELSSRHHPEYPRHSFKGFRMLRHRINPLVGTVALHHHQRWDGSGWPEMNDLTRGRYHGGLSGRRIHIFARIVAAANLFENLACGPAGKARRPSVFVLYSIRDARLSGHLDPVVLDGLLRCLQPFPAGTEVVLNNGRRGAVTEVDSDYPCRPKVRLLDPPWPADDLDLRLCRDLSIRRVGGRDVSAWLYELPAPVEMHALGAARGMDR